jgi:hypothetical protein
LNKKYPGNCQEWSLQLIIILICKKIISATKKIIKESSDSYFGWINVWYDWGQELNTTNQLTRLIRISLGCVELLGDVELC